MLRGQRYPLCAACSSSLVSGLVQEQRGGGGGGSGGWDSMFIRIKQFVVIFFAFFYSGSGSGWGVL